MVTQSASRGGFIQPAWASRLGPGVAALVVLILGASVSVLVAGALRSRERADLVANFTRSHERVLWLHGTRESQQDDETRMHVMDEVAAAYVEDPTMTQERMDRWARFLDNGDDLDETILLWSPWPRGPGDTTRYETAPAGQGAGASRPPGPGARDTARDTDAAPYPVLLVSPTDPGFRYLGLDLASEPVLRRALEWSRDSGAMAQIGRFPVPGQEDQRDGFLIKPLYRGATATSQERRRHFAGFVVTLVLSHRGLLGVGGLEYVALEERTGRDGETATAAAPSSGDVQDAAAWLAPALRRGQAPVQVTRVRRAGRDWTVLCYPTVASTAFFLTAVPGMVLAAGALLSALLALLVAQWIRRLREMKGLATRRTRELERNERHYARAGNNTADGLWDWDLKRQRIYYSRRWRQALDYEEHEIGNGQGEWFSRVHPEDLDLLLEALDGHLEDRSPYFEAEYRIRDRRGVYRWMVSRGVAIRNENGVPYRMVGSQTEVTQRKLAEARWQHDALHDPLTGLANRALFMDRLQQALEESRRESLGFAVLFLDVDGFKGINDRLGHLAGDTVLVAVARRIQNSVRPNDVVARLGGDEFTVLVGELAHLNQLNQARELAERIQKKLAEPLSLDGHPVVITASIGVTLSSNGYQSAAHVLRDADTAMYRAKAQGTARYEFFTLNMRHEARELIEFETDLRQALERDGLRVVYQAFVDVEKRRVGGFEALLRWAQPDRGLVQPEDLIKVAHETDLIIPLELWVLEEVCRQLLDWRRLDSSASDRGLTDDLVVGINLSPRQSQRRGFVEKVDQVLRRTGVPPRHVMFEMAENTMVHDTQPQLDTLRDLKELGVRILLDDFGTGYSSLHYLDGCQVDFLKVDRTLIHTDILGAIVSFAHSLGMRVIAEGVETDKDMRRLAAAGCDFAQGHYVSSPASPREAAQLVVDGHRDGHDRRGRILRSSRFESRDPSERAHTGRSLR